MSIVRDMDRAYKIFDQVSISPGMNYMEAFVLTGQLGDDHVVVKAGNLENAYENLVDAGVDLIMGLLQGD